MATLPVLLAAPLSDLYVLSAIVWPTNVSHTVMCQVLLYVISDISRIQTIQTETSAHWLPSLSYGPCTISSELAGFFQHHT